MCPAAREASLQGSSYQPSPQGWAARACKGQSLHAGGQEAQGTFLLVVLGWSRRQQHQLGYRAALALQLPSPGQEGGH